ncbi:MAG: hypothetical protein DBY41_05425 [Clostridium sp.]|uniref:glycosyltransferase n=1 Tax=Intestinibacter bartlettii TaxID=261299 RepID=UPI000D79C208|nr:MAG: hypothetical protein DBY41_05425 [Clostridium sp.]
MNKKISVIVPIYNVEQYLDKCVESLVNQTYKNLEIILVDDGTKDKSGEMADLWSIKDERIKVIHKENGGLSDARNAGMKIATGEYITFVDSDDWINYKMYAILINNLEKYNADISVCAVKKVYKEDVVNEKQVVNKEEICVFTSEEALENLLDEGILKQTVWNKLYKREVIDGIYFEFGKIHEDEFWTYQIFGKCEKIVYTVEQLYYYLQRSGSIMDKPFSMSRLDALEARNNRLNYIKQKFPKLEIKAKKSLFFSCLYQYQLMLKCEKIVEQRKYEQVIKKYIEYVNFNKDEKNILSLKENIWINLVSVSLDFTCKLRNLIGVGV